MLLEVRYENFRSMRKATVFDLSAESICEFRDSIMKWNRNKTDEYRIVPLKLLYGQNASGKTNLLLGIQVLKEIISAGRIDGSTSIPYKDLVNQKGKRKPIKLGITFLYENRVIQYDLCFDKEKILSESLWINCMMLFRRKGNHLELAKTSKAMENFDDAKLSSLELNEKQFHRYSPSDIFLTRGFKNFIAPTLATLIQTYVEERLLISLSTQSLLHHKVMLNNKEEVSKLLKNLNMEDALHDNVPQSQGTICFLNFADLFFTMLKEGGVLILDEMDASIDPNRAIPLLSMIHDPSINVHETQLIFTTFNPMYLNKYFLRRDEVSFVSKDEDGTKIKSLIAYANRENNYMRKYLKGEYETIAEIDERLLYPR